MFELRDYQQEAIETTRTRVAQGHRPIVCAATGSGKTVIAGHMARDAMDEGKRVLFISFREEILDQVFQTFNAICGVGNVGYLMANKKPFWFYPPVTIASADTLKARWHKAETWHIPADVILVDEAHLSLSKKMSETVMPHYRERTVIGFTATPARRTSLGLGSYYTRIIQVRSVQQLIDADHLAPCEYWAGRHADTEDIPEDRRTRDFKEGALSEWARGGTRVGDIVDNWLRIASDRHTIGFGVDIADAKAITEKFQAAGVEAEIIHSKMQRSTRNAISDQFRAQRFQVLLNVGIAVYGYDVPSINCVILGRPTKSIVLHQQMIGRGIRPNLDGGYTIVMDHADNVRRLGCIEDEIRWRLDEGREAAVNTTLEGDESRGKKPEAPPTECGNCHHIFSRSRVCPKCGWEKPVAAREVETVEADLVKVRKAQADAKANEWPDDREFFLMLRHHQERLRISFGWVLHSYKDKKAGRKGKPEDVALPPKAWNRLPTIPPSPRVRSWLHSRRIAYVKEKQKAERRATA